MLNYFINIMDINNILNINLDNDKVKMEFEITGKVVIKNILNHNFAEHLYNTVKKIPNKYWYNICGVRNTKYEAKLISSNNQRNKKNEQEAKKSFRKDEFSYNFYKTMEYRKNEVSQMELLLRTVLSSKLFLSMISYITNLNITNLNKMFLSKYKSGHFLSPHSDIGNGRIAYVLNLTKNWKPQYGGVLHFLNKERTEIIDSYVPTFNTLILFYVPEKGIPHFVSHIVPDTKKNRYAITGWLS